MRADVLRGLRLSLHWPTILPAAALLLVGLAVLADVDVRLGLVWIDDWHVRQLKGVVVGLAAATALLLVPYKSIVSRAYLLYAANLLLLVVVLVFGAKHNNARRWLSVAGFEFQPSELMKLTLVITLARFIRFRSSYKTFKGLWAPFLLTLVPMALILIQPDLGTSILCIPILFTTLFAAGARGRHLLIIVVLGALGMVPLYAWGLREYQRERVDGFLVQLGVMERKGRPAKAMEQDENYQLQRSKIAIGAGGFAGAEPDSPADHALYRVPERHTDFAFAALANRWGLLGAFLLLALFGWLLVAILAVAARHRDPAARLLCLGVFAMLGCQAAINLAMTVGLMPVTGLTLPFVSYGRSSIVVSILAVALVCNVAARPAYEFGRGDFD